MRLRNQKRSTNFQNHTWLPPEDQPGSLNYVQSPYGDLTDDEIEMMKSGANLNDIMFMRAMRDRQRYGTMKRAIDK